MTLFQNIQLVPFCYYPLLEITELVLISFEEEAWKKILNVYWIN